MSTPRFAAPAIEPVDAARAAFAADVRAGLSASPKRLAPRWFYDALGSSLFEAICRLPWYRITRAESALLGQHADRIAAAVGDAASIIELGGGSGEKLAVVLDAFEARGYATRAHLIDVSPRALELATSTLGRFRGLTVVPIEATYEQGLRHAVAVPAAGRQLVAFLGSNIGNFDPPEASALMRNIADVLRPGDLCLLGTDLVKPETELLLAYDDPLGVTAAFNKNVLQRMNVELGADISLDAFAHQARWDARHSRVELHLVSVGRQRVDVPRAGVRVWFDAGESIWTENSYKFEPDGIARLGARVDLALREQWIDRPAGFALTLFERT
jgi:L-histidine Nalpha-methyltransferase